MHKQILIIYIKFLLRTPIAETIKMSSSVSFVYSNFCELLVVTIIIDIIIVIDDDDDDNVVVVVFCIYFSCLYRDATLLIFYYQKETRNFYQKAQN